MVVDKSILDELTEKAKANPRLRCNFDLRTTPDDNSQRMLCAIEPGTQVPIHRHWGTTETVLCIRGHFKQCLYDDDGHLTNEIDMIPGGNIASVPVGQWHNIRSLESGSIMFEAKDGAYRPLDVDEIYNGIPIR